MIIKVTLSLGPPPDPTLTVAAFACGFFGVLFMLWALDAWWRNAQRIDRVARDVFLATVVEADRQMAATGLSSETFPDMHWHILATQVVLQEKRLEGPVRERYGRIAHEWLARLRRRPRDTMRS